MKIISLCVLILFISSLAVASEVTVKPKYWDTKRDGISDPGSSTNPYIIEDEHGKKYEIRPRYWDTKKDGKNDPGTSENPYEIKEVK